jgi:hypothetical protein
MVTTAKLETGRGDGWALQAVFAIAVIAKSPQGHGR